MPSSISSASSSPPSYASVLASSQSGSISASPQTSITRSSTTSHSSPKSSSTGSLRNSFSPKSYLTVHDLYMRYAPLKSLTRSTTSQVLLPKVLPPMILKDLFNKFVPKLSTTTSEPSLLAKTATPPTPTPSPQDDPSALF